MTIQLLAGSLLMAAGMSYSNSAQIHAPLPLTPANTTPAASPDPYIQMRLRQRQAQEQGLARLHADNAALIAKSVAARNRQLSANNKASGPRPATRQKVSLPVIMQ